VKIVKVKTILKKYPVYTGAVFKDIFPELIKKRFGDCEKILLVTNDKIFGIYENTIKESLRRCGLTSEIAIIRDGEEFKSLKSVDYLYGRLIDFNVHRNDVIAAFGGGVVGDITGFASATFHRGIKFIQCPTTIIGQVDSSIGGKVGVNYRNIKNIIGSFYQPDAVVIDPEFTYTLDEDQIINGLGEIVKYGIVFDKGILEKLERNVCSDDRDRLFKLVKNRVFRDIIHRCCYIKAKVVEKDEFDTGYRNLLNFGHTIGHSIENAFNLKDINHGRAVSIGMIIAIDISISLGFLKKEFKDRIIELYKKLKLPCRLPEINPAKILDVIKYDKKFKSSQNKFVLLKGLNKPVFYYNLGPGAIIDNIKKSMYN
jgi:3-dehydroquinate synthase